MFHGWMNTVHKETLCERDEMGDQEFNRIKKLDLKDVSLRNFKEILGGFWISHQR